MEEFHQSVRATLYERAKKPFTGTFILAWIACNWKLLVAIFFINEDRLNGTRIDYIESLHLLKSTNLVWEPLGVTVVAIVLFGILNILASLLVLKFKNFQFTHIDKRTNIDAGSYGELLDELKSIKEKWAKEIETLNTSRADLKSSNNEYILKNKIQNNEMDELQDKIDQYENSTSELNSQSNIYKEALKKASELLDRYIQDHGSIKRPRKLFKNMNKIEKSKTLEEIILGINKAYDRFTE